MEKKVWVATAKAWPIGVYARKADADAAVQKDIDKYINDLEMDGKEYIRRPLSVSTKGGDYDCEWNVEEAKFFE